MERPTDEQVHDALQILLDKKTSKASNYAVQYASLGMLLEGDDLHLQCLYVLYKMTHRHGEEATKAREILRAYINPL